MRFLICNSSLFVGSYVTFLLSLLVPQFFIFRCFGKAMLVVVGCGEGVEYLKSPGRPNDIDLQLSKACYPCSG